MPGAIEVLGPLLTFLSLELAAAGYLIKEVAENPRESNSIIAFGVFYGLSVSLALYYLTHTAWPRSEPSDIWLAIAGVLALASVLAYGAGLYFLQD